MAQPNSLSILFISLLPILYQVTMFTRFIWATSILGARFPLNTHPVCVRVSRAYIAEPIVEPFPALCLRLVDGRAKKQQIFTGAVTAGTLFGGYASHRTLWFSTVYDYYTCVQPPTPNQVVVVMILVVFCCEGWKFDLVRFKFILHCKRVDSSI